MNDQEHASAAPLASNQRETAEMCTAALHVLAQQIEAARKQMDAAVLDLSQRFSGMYASLESTVRAASAGDGSEHSITASFEASRGELHRVVEFLGTAFRRRDDAVRQVQAVTAHASALQGMVDRVAQLAAKTDLLALNATIEASRAGVHGRGFSVVAEEVRKLSHQSRQTSKDMSERVDAINVEIRAMAESTARAGAEERQTFDRTESSLLGVLRSLQEQAQTQETMTEVLRREGASVRQEIGQVMVALQFGDRVSQILVHATDSLQKLNAELDALRADPARSPDRDGFMQRVAQGYTTEEQRRNHGGVVTEVDDGGGDITFF